MNKPVYLGLSMLETSKTLMCKFWYDYIRPKYQDNAKICYIDTESFIPQIKMMLRKDLIHQIRQSRVPTGKKQKNSLD